MDVRPISGEWRALRPFLVAWGVLLLVLELAGATAARSLSRFFDFRSFYAAGYLLRTRPVELYNLAQQRWVQDHLIAPNRTLPFFSPAYEALMYVPFSLMHYEAAYLSFLAFNMVLLLAAFLVARGAFSVTLPIWQPRPGLMLPAFFPLLIGLLQGQTSVLLLLICCATWAALERGRGGLAGLILAAGLFKFNLILPIALVLAVWQGRRFIAGFMSGGAAVLGLSALLVGGSGLATLLTLLRAGSLAANQGATAQAAIAVFPPQMANLYGLVYALTHALHRPDFTFGVTMVLSAVLVVLCAWMTRREQRKDVAFSIAMLCGLLVSYHLYVHDLTLLVLPLALLYRLQHYNELMLAMYALPLVLLCFVGVNLFFLLTPLLLMVLWLIWRSQSEDSWDAGVTQAAGAL